MNSVLTCASGGWLMIATSVIFYSAVGFAVYSLINLFRDPATAPAGVPHNKD